MALEKRNISSIPSDAVRLSEIEALKYHTNLLNNWKVSSDVAAFKYGSFLLGGASTLSGLYLNNVFRTKFKVLHYGRITSYLPMCMLPSVLSFFFHQEFVLRDLILLKQPCPVCLEVRASAIQSFLGLLFPLGLAPASTLAIAHQVGTSNLPYITKQPLEVIKMINNKVKSEKKGFFWIFIAQALLGSAVTYFESESIYKVHNKLRQLEQKFQENNWNDQI